VGLVQPSPAGGRTSLLVAVRHVRTRSRTLSIDTPGVKGGPSRGGRTHREDQESGGHHRTCMKQQQRMIATAGTSTTVRARESLNLHPDWR
jgi:hypothetical protein